MPKKFSFKGQYYDFFWPTFKFINYIIVTKDKLEFFLLGRGTYVNEDMNDYF